MKIAFWNLAKNNIEDYVIDLILENNIDICIFAEYQKIDFDSVISKLKKYKFYDGMGGCTKIKLISSNECNVEIKREQDRYSIYSISINNSNYIIAGIHLQDRMNNDSDVRKNTIRNLIVDIKEQESTLKHSNTIVIGDFNASPFDEELVQKDAFNAVLFKDLILKTENVTFNGTRYKRFYNPMLNYISEDNSTYGTYYLSNGLKNIYWYFLDQIIVRKNLVSSLNSINIIKSINNKRLTKEILPNKDISDHLPLIAEFEECV